MTANDGNHMSKKNNTSFKPGEKRVVMKKGTKKTRTLVKESLGLTGWEKLCDYIKKEGAEKYLLTLGQLRGKDFVMAYNSLTEYVKPKLARTEVIGDPDKPLHISVTDSLTFEQLYQLKYGVPPVR